MLRNAHIYREIDVNHGNHVLRRLEIPHHIWHTCASEVVNWVFLGQVVALFVLGVPLKVLTFTNAVPQNGLMNTAR